VSAIFCKKESSVVAIIEHVLSDRPGDWRVSIMGWQGSDLWEMKITGPNAFERSYAVLGAKACRKRRDSRRWILMINL
jgi:hypothetical protein